MKAQTLHGPIVDPVFHLLNSLVFDGIEVGSLWKEKSDDTVAIFGRSLLPTVVGSAEIGSRPNGMVKLGMFGIFGPVIVSDGSSQIRGQWGKYALKHPATGWSRFVLYTAKAHAPAHSFNGRLKGGTSFADHEV